MGTVEQGARTAIEVCLGVKAGERVFIVTDISTRRIGEALQNAANRISPGNVKLALLEDIGKRPITSLPQSFEESIRWANVTLYAARSIGDELGLRMPFIKLAKQHARHGHMPSITERLMKEGMCADYARISELTRAVHKVVAKARTARVISPAGSDLKVEFNPDWRWKISDGIFHEKGEWGNLPDGELFTAAYLANGRIIAEELGDWFSDKYGVLESPVRIDVNNSRADLDQIKCSDNQLGEEFVEYLGTDQNSNRLGEFAIGTNTFLKELTGNLLQDEKYPSIHVAFGHPYPDETGADWVSRTHVDAIMRDATLWVDDRKIMENGHHLI